MIKCFINKLSEKCVAVSKWLHRHQILKKDSLGFWNFFQKSKDEGTVRLKVNAQTVVLARKLIYLFTCF